MYATKLWIIYKWTESTSTRSEPWLPPQSTAMIDPIITQWEVVTTGIKDTPKCLKTLNRKSVTTPFSWLRIRMKYTWITWTFSWLSSDLDTLITPLSPLWPPKTSLFQFTKQCMVDTLCTLELSSKEMTSKTQTCSLENWRSNSCLGPRSDG